MDKKYNGFYFSKSIRRKNYMMSHEVIDYIIFESDSEMYKQCMVDEKYTLLLLENSLLGIFLNNSEIIPLNIIHTYKNYDKSEKKKIVSLPNIIDPRLNKYFLEIPMMINKQIHEWNNNFYTLIKEINPDFPEFKELEIDENIYKCINCGIGFKESENTESSCKFHSGEITTNYPRRYKCCAKILDNLDDNCGPCRIGYHVKI